ncbi:MAG: hypothetical protein ACJ780_17970, partial [Solirubrobacteraceae bacterium]
EVLSRRTRALRYGASIAVALVGVGCGALIPGTAGGTAATVLVGLGLVGLVSLVFYEVGLTEDRDRAREALDREPRREDRDRRSPGPPAVGRTHQPGRPRPPERRRGQRRRLD